jgi:hypothetical protein
MTTIAQDTSQRNSARADEDTVEPILIAEWPIKRGEIVRVTLKDYKGTRLIDIRKFFEREDGDFSPTSKGIALNIKHLNRLSAAIKEASAVAYQRGLMPAGEGGQ